MSPVRNQTQTIYESPRGGMAPGSAISNGMRLVYFTSQKYPSKKTEPFFWKSMAAAFSSILGDRFTFVVRRTSADAFPFPTLSVEAPARFISLFYFFKLPALVRKHQWNTPETVFFGQDPYLLSILIFWRKAAGYSYRVCSDWHQLFGDWRDAYIARHSDSLITTSERLKHLLTERIGVSAPKATVAYGGVDLGLFAEKRAEPQAKLREKLGLPLDAYLVGYIGSVTSVGGAKGLEVLVDALAHLPEATMVIGGERRGELEPYRQQAHVRGVESRCIFLPWLPYEAYVECQLAMDILVIPYPDEPHYRDYGFPMKVWEYMAAGRPIVYSDLAIVREALGGRGRSFSPGDPQSLAAAIRATREDPQALRAARGNTEAVAAFTWEARAARILEAVQVH